MSRRLAAHSYAKRSRSQQLGLAGTRQTRAEGDGLADPDDILGLLGELSRQRRGLDAGDQLRVGEEPCLEGQPLGTLDLGLTDGKLRMDTLGPRQRVRQASSVPGAPQGGLGQAPPGELGALRGVTPERRARTGGRSRSRPSWGRDAGAARQHHEQRDHPPTQVSHHSPPFSVLRTGRPKRR